MAIQLLATEFHLLLIWELLLGGYVEHAVVSVYRHPHCRTIAPFSITSESLSVACVLLVNFSCTTD